MTENVPSDLHDQMVIEASFDDVDPRSSPAPPQKPFQVRTEEELPIRSLVLGTLLSGVILAICIATWLAALAAPIWAFRSLLQ